MDPPILQAARAWLHDPAIEDGDKTKIRELLEADAAAELGDRFYRQLQFGTGGLRGVIGAGLNRMNVYTVGAAAQGLAQTLAAQALDARPATVVIAYDCRRCSELFARRTASVMAGNGIRAAVFDGVRSTPQLSFTVLHLHASAGVVITASHNPPEYNGLKVYWSDGGQVVPPHDHEIIEQVRRVASFADVKAMPYDRGVADHWIQVLGPDLDEAFLSAVQNACLTPQISRDRGGHVTVVYTNLHGTGGTMIPRALRQRGFTRVIEVPEQAAPDGAFPTVASPNPEEAEALTLAIALARREHADLVIGTDPDADRVGIAVPTPQGDYERVSGNRVAALLTYYICEQRTREGGLPKGATLVTTVVSGDMMKDIARSYGAAVVETLTGFKWIGQLATAFESPEDPRTYLFGAEESYGYMPATYVRDKDAVGSAAAIADMAAWALAEQRSVSQLLEWLFERYGYYEERSHNVAFSGKAGAEQIRRIMARLRQHPPAVIGGIEVAAIGDLNSGVIRRSDGTEIGTSHLPRSDVMLFTLQDGSKVIGRPSGTEPKIKFYLMTREPVATLERAKAAAAARLDAMLADVCCWAGESELRLGR